MESIMSLGILLRQRQHHPSSACVPRFITILSNKNTGGRISFVAQ
jgi:hypothetical protein